MSNTVKARFAIVVEPNGAWNIAGPSSSDDQQMEDWAAEFITYPSEADGPVEIAALHEAIAVGSWDAFGRYAA